jgi:hypothetical protein
MKISCPVVRSSGLSLLMMLAAVPLVEAAAVSAGNLVIYRVGTGAAGLTTAATAVFLDEYTPTGTLVQSIPVPTTGTTAMTAVGNATTEGTMSVSGDGSRLVFAGYRKDAGGTSPASDTASVTNRVVGMLGLDGSVNTSTAITDSTGALRSATAASPTSSIYLGTANGVRYVAGPGAPVTSTVIDTRNSRQVVQSGGILFAGNGSTSITAKVQSYGAGPTTATVATPVITLTTADVGNSFWFADLSGTVAGDDTMYLVNQFNGSILKFTSDGSSWTASGSFSASAAANVTGIPGDTGVDLFVTSGSTLFKFSDTTGYGGLISGAATSIATLSVANTAFRGLAAFPVPEPTVAVLGLMASLVGLRRRR